MLGRDFSEHHVLVVTGPDRDRLYERFRILFFGRDDVEVVKDRRRCERRAQAAPTGRERRAGERRHAVVWVVPPR